MAIPQSHGTAIAISQGSNPHQIPTPNTLCTSPRFSSPPPRPRFSLPCCALANAALPCSSFHAEEIDRTYRSSVCALATASHAQPGQIGAKRSATLSGAASKSNNDESRPPHQDQLQSGRSQEASASKPSANTASGQSTQKHRDKRAQLRQWHEEGKKASLKGYKDLKPHEFCPTCGKRHRGECRTCSCGGWHKEANCLAKKRATTGDTGRKPNDFVAARPQQEVGEKPPAMDRRELLEVLSRNIYTEQGAATYTKLMEAGDRPAHLPDWQLGAKPGEYPRGFDQFTVLQMASHRIRTEEGVANFISVVNAGDRPVHFPWAQEPQKNADAAMAGWEEW